MPFLFGNVVLIRTAAHAVIAPDFYVNAPLAGGGKDRLGDIHSRTDSGSAEYLYLLVIRGFNLQSDLGLFDGLLPGIGHVDLNWDRRAGLEHGRRFEADGEIRLLLLRGGNQETGGQQQKKGSFHVLILAPG